MTPADQLDAEEEARRRAAEVDLDVPIVNAIKGATSDPVVPVRLTDKHSFCFNCHKGVSCWNECCHDTDITLTPYDLIRLGRHLDMPPGDVGRMFGSHDVHEASGMPVLKLNGSTTARKNVRACSSTTNKAALSTPIALPPAVIIRSVSPR